VVAPTSGRVQALALLAFVIAVAACSHSPVPVTAAAQSACASIAHSPYLGGQSSDLDSAVSAATRSLDAHLVLLATSYRAAFRTIQDNRTIASGRAYLALQNEAIAYCKSRYPAPPSSSPSVSTTSG
jgi:hypothetical protein